jgi:4-amino-4-deoxy-L-arabinose transferase-like glycosyltransferase
MDPLYPYMLAVLNRIFGRDLMVIRLFQALMGVATCGLVGVIGRRVGGRAVGTVSAMFLALYQPLVFEGGEIEKTALGVFLITATLAFATGRSGASFFCAGVCLALATLTRGNLLLLVPLGTVFFLLPPEAQADLQQPSGFLRRWIGWIIGRPGRNAIVFLLGVLLILSPVLWRNYYVSGELTLTTSQFGQNFYTGNNPSNWSGAFTPCPSSARWRYTKRRTSGRRPSRWQANT